jgi:SAM-dependent methyltransferase
MKFVASAVFGTLLVVLHTSEALVPHFFASGSGGLGRQHRNPSKLVLHMGKLDLVTYLRTEWISAALCTNQTPRSADVCLQLGVQDGRVVTFVPRTIREIITSSAEPDGKLTVTARRQLKQQQERRKAATVTYIDQRADDLKETADESVDVVMSLQAAQVMIDNGFDWKRSVREAVRVLKPGGRLLFVEQTELAGESYLDYLDSLYDLSGVAVPENSIESRSPLFEEVGYDDVDLVLTPHVAGVAVKSMDAGLTPEERAKKIARQEKERLAGISIEAYERGIKKRRKKNKVTAEPEGATTASAKSK